MGKKKYSDNFTRDFNYFIKYRNFFTFTGGKPELQLMPQIKYDPNGVDGKRAFFNYDSNGKFTPTRHPNIFGKMLCVKAAINLQIKQWAQGRADGTLPGWEFKKIPGEDEQPLTIEEEYELLPWIVEAVEQQKYKYYKYYFNVK